MPASAAWLRPLYSSTALGSSRSFSSATLARPSPAMKLHRIPTLLFVFSLRQHQHQQGTPGQHHHYSTDATIDHGAPSAGRSFTYRMSAAFSAKQHALDLARNHYTHDAAVAPASHNLPALQALPAAERKRQRYQSGQDAFFVAQVPAEDKVAFAVLDGVGGWTDSGVDPADFAHGMAEYMAHDALTHGQHDVPFGSEEDSEGVLDREATGAREGPLKTVELMTDGYDAIQRDTTVPAGGSTATVGTVTRSGQLEIANLGDSGYIHLSPFAIPHLSTAQTHAFNTPFQLAKIPAHIVRQMKLFGNTHFSEHPRDSDVYRHALAHGDVFVLATDGLWDNLSPEDVLRIVQRVMLERGAWVRDAQGAGGVAEDFTARLGSGGKSGSAGKNVAAHSDLSTELSMALLKESKECGWNTKRDGPFAREVKRAYPYESWHGGKPDDICVVVGVVVEEGVSE